MEFFNNAQAEIDQYKKEAQETLQNFPRPRLPVLEEVIVRDWLSRFFALRDEKVLKKYLREGLIEKVGDTVEEVKKGEGRLAPIMGRAPYLGEPLFPFVEGLSDYEVWSEGGITEEAYLWRLKALLYASPLSPKSRTLGWWEEVEEQGRLSLP